MNAPEVGPADDRSEHEITRLLVEASNGNREAFDRLFPLVYDELRVVARGKLRKEAGGHTLTPTALVHEAYVGLAQQDRVEWQGRAHFFAVAAAAMRRVLIDYARARQRHKRGGGEVPMPLDEAEEAGELMTETQADELLALDEALTRLTDFNPDGAQVVMLRFFGGLQHTEIAEMTGVSEVTIRRRWAAARAWLHGQLHRDFDGDPVSGMPD